MGGRTYRCFQRIFLEAILATNPKAEIQLCIVHQIRNSLKFIGSSNQKEFLRDLKEVY
ncbi:MAG: transposase [Silvanigrellaceae bacterium]|nr:transposase [Silvanigrellaceae bacterium]